MGIASSFRSRANRWLRLAIIILLTLALAIVMVGLLAWQVSFGDQLQLEVGEVAPFDVMAPRQITYESQLLTERARERAAQAVADQYDSAEGRVRRQQVSRMRQILEFITLVRNDPYATPDTQVDYLLALTDLTLTPEAAAQILEMDAEEWALIVAEAPTTLDRAMRAEIRDNTLASVRRSVSSHIDSDLTEDVSDTVVDIVRPLIRPNMFLNVDRTEELREKARQEVAVQMRNLERSEIILRAGDIATAEDVEALTQVGLLQTEWNWWVAARAAFFTLILLAMAAGVLYRLHPATLVSHQEVALLVATTVIWLVAAKFMIVPHDWLSYLYPLAALGMLVSVLVHLRAAVVVTLFFTMVVHYLGANNVPLTVYMGVGTLLGAVVLGRAERLTAFLWAGVVVAVSNVVVLAAFWAPFTDFSTPRLLQLHVVAMLNGGLSASIAVLSYYVLGNLFGITTSLQLTELSRPTHPLLRQLLLKASGTYHHTIVVSNLAERAAAAIGADAFLARVGAYYHDIGKTVRPYFFLENMADGVSPHEQLDPLTSAQIIISHVKDGLDLAQKYRLPPRIQDFIREHHGRSLVKYFYAEALSHMADDGQVRESDFRYLGPSPRSRETAILLLADTCEAAVRAMRPATREDLEALIGRLIDERVAEGELNDCNLTFRELQITKEVFVQVLQGVHHPRVVYPELVHMAEAAQGAPRRPAQVTAVERYPPAARPSSAPAGQPGNAEAVIGAGREINA